MTITKQTCFFFSDNSLDSGWKPEPSDVLETFVLRVMAMAISNGRPKKILYEPYAIRVSHDNSSIHSNDLGQNLVVIAIQVSIIAAYFIIKTHKVIPYEYDIPYLKWRKWRVGPRFNLARTSTVPG